MNPLIKQSAFVLFITWIFHFSCQKELFCDRCASKTILNPMADAGPDQKIELPIDSALLDGSHSSDPEKRVISNQWTKISGPGSFNIISPTDLSTKVKALITGIYLFELKLTYDGVRASKDTVQITVNNLAHPNQAPVANAGADQSIASKSLNTVTLDGSLSTDPDNNITGYSWTKISGPNSFILDIQTAVQTQITNLVLGVYQFELTVTDAGGLFAKDTVQITINCDITNRPTEKINFSFTSLLPNPRYGTTVAAIGDKIVIAGGFTSDVDPNLSTRNYSNSVDIYDIVTGQWTHTQLSEPRAFIAFAVLGNKIFFAGGENSNGQRTSVDIYDVSINKWSITHLSYARYGIAGGTIDNKVFFAGGITHIPIDSIFYTSSLVSIVDIFNDATNSWITASLSEGRYCLQDLEKITVTVVGQEIYFSGGSCNIIQDCSSTKIDIFNASTNSWSQENYMPQNGGSLFSGIASGNKNYRVTGDYWEGGNIVEIRDEKSRATSYECLSGTLYRAPFMRGSKLIFPVSILPQFTTGYKLSHFDIYDLTSNTWLLGSISKSDKDLKSFVLVNNNVYAFSSASTSYWPKYDKLYKLD